MGWKKMRLLEEGVDNLGFKRKRLRFQGQKEGKAGEVFFGNAIWTRAVSMLCIRTMPAPVGQ